MQRRLLRWETRVTERKLREYAPSMRHETGPPYVQRGWVCGVPGLTAVNVGSYTIPIGAQPFAAIHGRLPGLASRSDEVGMRFATVESATSRAARPEM